MEIRRYRPNDQQRVWELHNVALDQAGANLGPGPWDDDFKDLPGVYLDGTGEFLVGVVGGAIVSMGAVRRISDTRAEIKRLRVDPNHQGRGYGRRMLEELEAAVVALGYSTIQLDTTLKQVAARSLFLTSGYREIGREAVHDVETLFLEKSVGPDT